MPPAFHVLMKYVRCKEGILQLITLIAVIFTLFMIYRFRHQLVDFRYYAQYGYLGLLLFNIIGAAALVLPVPIDVAIIVAGALLNPLLVSLVASTGQVLGEMTGYLLGYSGRPVIENRDIYTKMHDWMRRRGSLTIFVLKERRGVSSLSCQSSESR